jgi:hypothetical protein
MNFILMLSNIKEHLIAPCLAFAQTFQLQGYEQYGIHESVVSVVNVPTNLNLVQNVLLCMPYDDLSIVMFLERKLEYKSIYDRLCSF